MDNKLDNWPSKNPKYSTLHIFLKFLTTCAFVTADFANSYPPFLVILPLFDIFVIITSDIFQQPEYFVHIIPASPTISMLLSSESVQIPDRY